MSSPNSSFAAYLASMDVWSSTFTNPNAHNPSDATPLAPPSSTSSMTGITLTDSLLASSPNKRARSDSPDTSITTSEDGEGRDEHEHHVVREGEAELEKYFQCSSPSSMVAIPALVASSSIAITSTTTVISLTTHDPLPFHSPNATSSTTSRSFSHPHLTFTNLTTLTPLHPVHPRPDPCTLRSILHPFSPTCSSPPSSKNSSPPLSRRSSTGGASSKSVRFARCTNASVFPALSGEEYDRSPIVPTCESESLALPRRKRSEAEGWIKCVERERAAAAKAKAGRGGKGKIDGGRLVVGATACMPVLGQGMGDGGIENPVEGVHGLIEGSNGGYFVGEERGERGDGWEEEEEEDDEDDDDEDGEGDDNVETDDMVVDDQEEDDDDHDQDQDEEGMALSIAASSLILIPPIPLPTTTHDSLALPLLVHMDDSSGDDSDHHLLLQHPLVTPPFGSPLILDPLLIVSGTLTPPVVVEAKVSGSSNSKLGFGMMDRSISISVEEEEEKRREEGEGEGEVHVKGAKKNGRDRYGLCALGKYSRAEVFQSYDSLGGF